MKRITSIDALRAFALLGILILHVRQGFGVETCSYKNIVDLLLGGSAKFLLSHRCMLIFNILFGVSFFIILGKKDYPSSKFVWRCLLLACLGLFNRFFYDGDVLFKYGLCGMALVLIRKQSNNRILWLSLYLIIVGIVLKWCSLGDCITLSSRYVRGEGLKGLLLTYPNTLLYLLEQFLNGDYFIIFANMAIGYWLGRIGLIESMDNKLSFGHVVMSLIVYLFFGVVSYGRVYLLHITIHPLLGSFLLQLCFYSGMAFYWVLFIYSYNHIKSFRKFSTFLESYGKCGLTNYSMQGFIGIIVFYFFEIGYIKLPYTVLVLFSMVFFVLQALFCLLWLKKFKNGPLEYLWRCATERKWLQIRR